MKFSLLFLLILFPVIALANQTFVGISPSDLRTNKIGVTLGLGSESWAGSLTAIFNSEYSDSDFVDIEIPHSDYQDLGKRRINNMLGIDVTRTWEIYEQWPSIFVGGGLYFGRESKIVRSNASGLLWAQDKNSVFIPAVSAGVKYGVDALNKYAIGLDFHTIRGFGFMFFFEI